MDIHNNHLLERLQERMSHFCVPGAGLTIFQENQLECSLSLGLEEAGKPLKVNADSIFHACSMSKMVTSIGILKLVQEGLLDLQEDANVYLKSWKIPENPYTIAKKVTISSLLAHQSGFVESEGSFDICQKQSPFPAPKDLLLGNTTYLSESAEVKYVPDSEFHYADTGFTILELIIEDVMGESFISAIDKLVFAPLGLHQTFFWNGLSKPRIAEAAGLTAGHNKHGNVVDGTRAHYPNLSGAGLWTTPSEMALIAIEVIKAWGGDHASLLSPALAQKMLTGYGCAQYVGLGVFLSQANGEPSMLSKGWGIGYQCMLVAYPRLKCGIVVMTNSEPGKPQEEALIGEMIRSVSQVYKWPAL
ncbi:serine hydrolase domain-containing protein [Paenibacillus sp. PL91]|uniref:serine hydrolase domain-containing protein n=1 Tax=Paenibacillus sp. PL91 TaxID=2729538 RepID=UPI00145E8340|nr:serine hydrolase domain-containing protein [Paenibacillus sp. PL91]MBC9203850.1 beta-lactamase family protein [Paenibacillus sp. PL91]